MDDLKINLKPKLRLLLMIVFISFLVVLNNFYVTKTGIEFLNRLLEIDIFSLMFTSLCFLFLVNGSNLIDGSNGLLGNLTSSSLDCIIIAILFIIMRPKDAKKKLSNLSFFIKVVLYVS